MNIEQTKLLTKLVTKYQSLPTRALLSDLLRISFTGVNDQNRQEFNNLLANSDFDSLLQFIKKHVPNATNQITLLIEEV